jgi:EVE domain
LATTVAPSPTAGAMSTESRAYWLTAVSDDQETTAQEIIRTLLAAGWYVYGERTPGRKRLQVGDRLCFYESGVGVVAAAEVASAPERRALPMIRDAERYPWAFHVTNVRYFFDAPVVIDASLRAQLDAFQGREPSQSWAWFVQATHAVTEHDFHLLTAQAAPTTSSVTAGRRRSSRAGI